MPDDSTASAPPHSGALITYTGASPRLRSLISSEIANEDAAVQEISESRVLIDAATTALPELKRLANEPAGEAGVRRVLGAYLPLFPQPERGDAEWRFWWQPYFDTCSSLAMPALEAGMKAYVAMTDSEFMPKPGRLRELAMTVHNPSAAAYWIALRGVNRADDIAKRAAHPILDRHTIQTLPEARARTMPTAADRAAVQRMRADFSAQHEAAKPPRAALPSPTPVTFAPGLHISAAMVDVMRRRDPYFTERDERMDDADDSEMFS